MIARVSMRGVPWRPDGGMPTTAQITGVCRDVSGERERSEDARRAGTFSPRSSGEFLKSGTLLSREIS